ncbi:MAG: hypothetical protein MI923_23965 [Phycisphaerales bacterium]|nr:hypothetical protein [Phycisphaerales bacterium]
MARIEGHALTFFEFLLTRRLHHMNSLFSSPKKGVQYFNSDDQVVWIQVDHWLESANGQILFKRLQNNPNTKLGSGKSYSPDTFRIHHHLLYANGVSASSPGHPRNRAFFFDTNVVASGRQSKMGLRWSDNNTTRSQNMGLGLRFSVFQEVTPEQVLSCFDAFFQTKNRQFSCADPDHHLWSRWDFYEPENGWTVLDVGYSSSVKDRREWREFQCDVCEKLDCLALLLFVYDGDYWGYDLMVGVRIADQFVQNPEQGAGYWEDGTNLSGDVDLLVQHLPWIARDRVAPYLVPRPPLGCASRAEFQESMKTWDVKCHPNDEHTRRDQCAILDFLRVPAKLENGYVHFTADLHKSLWTKMPNEFEL